MRVLVTGVKGQLGYHVVQELEKRNHTAIGVDIEEMDITNAEETLCQLRESLMDAQRQAEELFLEGKEPEET